MYTSGLQCLRRPCFLMLKAALTQCPMSNVKNIRCPMLKLNFSRINLKPTAKQKEEVGTYIDPMSFAPFLSYLQQIKLKIHTYNAVQHQVLQGFYYGLIATAMNDAILGDVDTLLGFAGESFVKHYRSDCAVFHADFAHLAAAASEALEGILEEAVQTFASQCEGFFTLFIPAPHNTVFSRLADGEEVVVSAPIQRPQRAAASLASVRKTLKRRRRRAASPPAKAAV